MSIMGKNQWIIPYKGYWAVRGEGNPNVTKVFLVKSDAIEFAKKTAKNQHSELFILGRNGKIQSRNSYGNDPYPPIG